MSRKAVLSSATVFLGSMFAFTAMYVLSTSLVPSARAVHEVGSFKIDDVPVGALSALVTGENYTLWVIRPYEGQFRIFGSWHARGTPHYVYGTGRYDVACEEITYENGAIHCINAQELYVLWNLEGVSNKPWLPDIRFVPYKVAGRHVRYGPGA